MIDSNDFSRFCLMTFLLFDKKGQLNNKDDAFQVTLYYPSYNNHQHLIEEFIIGPRMVLWEKVYDTKKKKI